MDKDKIIDGLRMTMDLCVFDPSTGEEIDPDMLNDINRATYDACKGALEILERLDTDSDTISRQAAIDALNNIEIPRNASWYQYYQQALTAVGKLPPALSTNLAEVGTDLISRQQAIDICRAPHMRNADCSDFEMAIMMLPPAQPERIKGRWIIRDNPGTGWYRVTCSECGEDVTSTAPCIGFFPNAKVIWDFCPNCGRDMREE